MTLQSTYYIGQTIAAIAILGSLIAIYFQQKRANEYEVANGQRDLLNRAKEVFSLAAKDEAALAAVQSGLHDYHAMGDFQKATFSTWVLHVFMTIQQSYYLSQVRLVENDVHQAYINYAMAVFNNKGGRDWWVSEGSKILDAEYAAHLEQVFTSDGDQYPALTDIVPHYRMPNVRIES